MQYLALGDAQLSVAQPYSAFAIDCGFYCGDWYDAMGFGNNIYSTGASGPDIEYPYPVIIVSLPAAGKVIAMKESRATAWGPSPTPVITLVSPSSWNAGTNTSFTINGSGFGTAPTLSIVGNGITIYNIVWSPSARMI